MNKFFVILTILLVVACISCSNESKSKRLKTVSKKISPANKVIVDAHFTFQQAVAGTKAPQAVLDQLQLIEVQYYSTDGKIHQGQLLTNKQLVGKLQQLFVFMLQHHFPVSKVVPVVKYHWNDDLSMQDNNTYSFCYRNISYSKHATGMAIDINPFFNPVRWKGECENRRSKPVGAVYNPNVSGTFTPFCPLVKEFKRLGFRWGHSFTRSYDDHHFEL